MNYQSIVNFGSNKFLDFTKYTSLQFIVQFYEFVSQFFSGWLLANVDFLSKILFHMLLSHQRSIKSLSSAGRRKTKELKSNNIIPKEVSPRQPVKQRTLSNKVKEINKSHDDTEETKDTKKTVLKQVKIATTKDNQNIRQRNSVAAKPAARVRDNPIASQVKGKKGNGVSSAHNKNVDLKNTGVISQSDLASLMEAIKQGDTSAISAFATQMQQENQLEIPGGKVTNKSGAQPKNRDLNVTEPTFVPGKILNH